MVMKGHKGDSSIRISYKPDNDFGASMSRRESMLHDIIIDCDKEKCLKHRYVPTDYYEGEPEFKEIIQKAKELHDIMK